MSEVEIILGYPFAAATMGEVVDQCDNAITSQTPIQISVMNAAKVVNAGQDPELYEAVLSCDLILADGQAVVWASRLLGQPLPERVTGIDLFLRLLELADAKHYSVFLLGGTAQVNETVVQVIEATYPGARIVGHQDGYYLDEDSVARGIASCRPDMLFLGMNSPKKELFLKLHHTLMHVPVTHGVGGSFDVLAGVTKRAPELWQKMGMEWAYRLLQEPRRMWKRYLRTNVVFIFTVAGALARQRLGLQPQPPSQRM